MRNYSWTLNRRLRRFGWQFQKFPKAPRLPDLIEEMNSLKQLVEREDLADLQDLLNGFGILASANIPIYSQLGQDAFVLGKTVGKSNNFFLEIGAYDPYLWSNTAGLREFGGWSGFHIDPSPASAQRFSLAGLGDSFVEAAALPVHQNAFFDDNDATSEIHSSPVSKESIQVRTVTPSELIKKYERLDYLSLDIEGGELELLKAWPFDFCAPRIITVEHNYRKMESDQINFVLNRNGYRKCLTGITEFESWYIRDEKNLTNSA